MDLRSHIIHFNGIFHHKPSSYWGALNQRWGHPQLLQMSNLGMWPAMWAKNDLSLMAKKRCSESWSKSMDSCETYVDWYMYIHTYVCICLYTYIYIIYIHTHTHTCIYTSMFVYVCVYVSIYIYIFSLVHFMEQTGRFQIATAWRSKWSNNGSFSCHRFSSKGSTSTAWISKRSRGKLMVIWYNGDIIQWIGLIMDNG